MKTKKQQDGKVFHWMIRSVPKINTLKVKKWILKKTCTHLKPQVCSTKLWQFCWCPFWECWKCDPFKVCWWPPTMWSKRSRIESPGASLQLGVKSIYPILTSGLICIKLMTKTVSLMHFHKIFLRQLSSFVYMGVYYLHLRPENVKKKSIGIHHKPCYMLNFSGYCF